MAYTLAADDVEIERLVESAVGFQTGDVIARHPPMPFAPLKTPPAKILPSACTAIAFTATVRVRVERISQAGRGIEPGDVIARLSADAVRSVEIAAR